MHTLTSQFGVSDRVRSHLERTRASPSEDGSSSARTSTRRPASATVTFGSPPQHGSAGKSTLSPAVLNALLVARSSDHEAALEAEAACGTEAFARFVPASRRPVQNFVQ